MPSTITTYNTFTANTRARASQVNTNFDNYRGTLLPINTDSASASDLAHDLGSSDHRWRYGYMQYVSLYSSTSTAGLIIEGDTADTTGAFLFKINSVTKAKIDTNGIDGAYIKTASVPPASLAPGIRTSYGLTFSASGSWTVPSGVYWIRIRGVGAGGGGGGAANTNPSAGGAGGCGCIPTWEMAPVTPGNVLSITVGAGGAGGLANANPGQSGATGGSSIVAGTGIGSVTFVGAPGGPGGESVTAGSYMFRSPSTIGGYMIFSSVHYTRKNHTRGGRGGDNSTATEPLNNMLGESSPYALGGYHASYSTNYGGCGGAGLGAGGAGQTSSTYSTTATSGGIGAGGGGGCGRATGGGGPGGPGGNGQIEIYWESNQ